MKQESMNQAQQAGIVYTASAYMMWGVFPLYWKLLDQVPADEILAHRVIWSFAFMMILLYTSRQLHNFKETFKELMKKPKQIMALLAASVLISLNWFIYIWAVNNDHIIEASLGYYINPLVSILLGIVVLKEKLNFWQGISVLLAAVGVLFLTMQYGQFPWISILLALSFGIYGLVKKLMNMDAKIGLTFETLMVTPVALIYFLLLMAKGTSSFGTASILDTLLLIGGGVATAMPLLYFAKGAKLIPLSMVGFLQYIAPTITLFLGVFVFHEHFTKVHMVAFLFIWGGSIVFALSKTRFMVSHQPKLRKSRSVGM
ncbi:chloramphenicol-sensitive protein RarD [Bacillus iocasae]|uniref:Chloramphenicol-sensitive protein RarD n=2 Tax=Priestia iocasae TaxID=2291674 RepID=A0ABS2QSQ3_9BACI|nr:chloramphenicol-sensitive protein RarD [Metabacillus iocasae]